MKPPKIAYYDSPLGLLEIAQAKNGISSITFALKKTEKETSSRVLKTCVKQLDEYFKGKRKEFFLALDPEGSEFQVKVWNALMTIPFGETRSYGEIASVIESPSAARAIGHANGANPIPIIIPCHRVIGADRTLVGYGGGIWRKLWLLEFERNLTERNLFNQDLKL
jgi:methylated-DNA-[protein]-cysteine S-methyltransferase